MEIEKIYILEFDRERMKYYFEKDNTRKYISCGDKITIIYADEEKKGTIEYSKTVSKGYYLLLDSTNYIPLFLIEKIKTV